MSRFDKSKLQAMFGGGALWSGQATYLILEYLPELLVGVVASMPLLPALKGWLGRPDHPGRDRFRTLAEPAAALVLGALSVVGLVSSGFNPFIYFQF